MYLISAYFDESANKRLQQLIDRIAAESGNHFMLDHHVPPHMTLSSMEARNPDILLPHIEPLQDELSQGTVQFVSVGMFFPYVIYAAPVLNEYLRSTMQQIYDRVAGIEEVSVSRYYRPMQSLPHVTLGKQLSKEQMRAAFAVVQNGFTPFGGKIVSVGLAKTNPHEDVWRISL